MTELTRDNFFNDKLLEAGNNSLSFARQNYGKTRDQIIETN